MSVAEQFEILCDETIKLLDENKEPILLKMICINCEFDNRNRIIVFDSKKRIFNFSCNANHQFPQIEHFYYSYSGLKHGDIMNGLSPYGCPDPIIRYFYDKRDEYWPTFGLTNFELK